MLKKLLLPFLLCSAAIAAEPVIKLDFENAAETKKMPTADGVSGKGILLTNQEFVIPSQGKVTPAEGSVTFWIKPVDWDMNSKEFKFLLSAEDTKAQKGRMIIYKYKNPGLGFTFLFGANGKVTKDFIYTNKDDKSLLNKNQWNFIAATWNTKANLISFYINGKLINSAYLKKDMFFEKFTNFKLNTRGFAPYDRKQKTVYDSIHFYKNALSEKDVNFLYQAQLPRPKLAYENLKDPIFTLPLIKTPPVIDGNFVDSEWAGCARTTGYTLTWNQNPELQSDMPTDLYVGTDGKNLYFCTSSRLNSGSDMKTTPRERDGAVYADDAVEVHITPANSKENVHLIYNGLANIYDKLGTNVKWNGKWNIKSGIYEGLWIAEVAIPLSELKGVFKDGDVWKVNFCRDYPTDGKIIFSSLGASSYLYKPSVDMKLAQSGTAARFFINYRDLDDRKINTDLEILNPGKNAQNVTFCADIIDANNKVLRSEKKSVTIAPASIGKFNFSDKLAGISCAIIRIGAVDEKGNYIFRQDVPLRFEDKIAISFDTNIKAETLTIDVDCSRHISAKNTAKVKAEIIDKNNKVFRTTMLKGTTPANGVFSLKSLPVGEYFIRCSFFDANGKELLTHKQPYDHIGQPEWIKRKSGTNLKIPHPYTKLVWKNNTLSCIGRTHTFGKNLIPDSITSQKTELFAAKPQLTFVSKGKKYIVDNFNIKPTKTDDQFIDYVFNGKAADITFEGTLHTEFDGFFWYDLKIIPSGSKAEIDNLRLTLTYPDKVATMFNAHFFARENRVGKVSKNINLKRFPSVWLGNLDVGLTFFTESFEFWRNRDENYAYTIEKNKNNVKLNINFIDKKTVISAAKPFNYAFGIEANPVKPTSKKFRSWRVFGHNPYNISHPWQVDRSTKKYPGSGGFFDPTFTSVEGFRKNIDDHKKKNALFTVYLNAFIASGDSTEFKIFNKEWANPYNAYPNCPNSSFTDYITWRIEHLINNGLQSVYVDSLGAVNCYNPVHKCGYIAEDGKTGLTYPIRASRNYMKRIYTMLHQPGRDQEQNFLWAHMSARTSAPINAFVDFQASGEEVEYKVMKESNYMRLYSLDEFQIYFMHNSGVIACLLPNLGRVGPKSHRYIDKYNDQIILHCLLHDVILWMAWCNERTLIPFYNKLDKWGYTDTDLEFASYRIQNGITCSNPEIKISYYRLKKANKLLAVIGNIGENSNTFKLNINKKVLGIGENLNFTDFRSGKTVNPENITLPQFGLLVMEVKAK